MLEQKGNIEIIWPHPSIANSVCSFLLGIIKDLLLTPASDKKHIR